MKARFWLRVSLLLYLAFILVRPQEYTLYDVYVNAMAALTSMSSIAFFIVFLRSRTNKSVLNMQMLMHFYFKLIYHPYYFMISYLGYSSKNYTMTAWKELLMSTVLSYSSARVMVILSFTMYNILSVSRTLLFISPVLFNSLDKSLVLHASNLVMVAMFLTEVTLSQVVFGPGRCDVNENGIGLHTLPFANQTFSETPPRACTLFPTLRILLLLLILLEVVRLTTAVVKKVKMLKKSTPFPVSDVRGNLNSHTNPAQEPPTSSQIVEMRVIVSNSRLSRSESWPMICPKSRQGSNYCTSTLSNIKRRSSALDDTADFMEHSKYQQQPQQQTPEPFPEQSGPFDGRRSRRQPNYDVIKSYVSFLIFRTYTLVIVIALAYFLSFLLPSQFRFVSQLTIHVDLAYLDLYFVPVFWLLLDREASWYTWKCFKKTWNKIKLSNLN